MLLIKKRQLNRLLKERGKIPDEFWVPTKLGRAIWFIDGQNPSVQSSYDFDVERFGVTREGNIIWGYDSGCSCPSPWESDPYHVTTYKEFFLKELPEFDPAWKDTATTNIGDYLKLIDSVDEKLDANEVFHIRNQEIRRFIMKRIGYDKIKKDVKAKTLHTDRTSELLKISFGEVDELYVKVTDHSTDREYLLYVPSNIKTCREGIAWTFGLNEKDYNPLIET